MLTYIVHRYDSLQSIAQQFGTTYQEIMTLNQLNTFRLYIGQELLVPNTIAAYNYATQPELVWAIATDDDLETYPTALPQMPPNTTSSRDILVSERGDTHINYTVKAGDNLSKIANLYKTTPELLKKLNKLISNVIWAGQILKVPAPNTPVAPPKPTPPPKTYIVKAGDSLTTIAWIFNITVEMLKKANQLKSDTLLKGQILIIPQKSNTTPTNTHSNTSSNNNTNLTPLYYTVKLGEGLWGIATSHKISINDLLKWNKLPNTNALITPGQKLIVGYKTNTVTPPAPPTPVAPPPPPTPVAPPPPIIFTSKAADKITLKALTFTHNRLKISNSVGQGGYNLTADVVTIQKTLLQLGFLAAADLEREQPKPTATTVASNAIPQTIAALQRFNQVVADQDNADEPIKPNSQSLQFMDNAAMPLSETDINSIETARAQIKMQELNAREIFFEPLTAPVGATPSGNMPNDVRKVQTALKIHGYLIPEQEIPKPDTPDPIPQTKLTETIAAIRDFQKKRVTYWIARTYITGDTDYLEGIVNKNSTDLTFKIMGDYTQYQISFALNNGQTKQIRFDNHTQTPYTVDFSGISFNGNIKPSVLGIEEYEKIGLNIEQARALKYVSEHEGNFDAINSYDRALFSYGFIQFAGGNRGLAPTIALFKHLYPQTFANEFQRYGIDVEYSIANGDIQKAQLAVFDPRVQKWLRRVSAETLLKNDKRLTALFIKAAYHPDLQRAQIESAVRRYVVPALGIKFSKHLKVGDKIVATAGQPLTIAIRSVKGITALIDLSVNRWIVAARDAFEDAIKVVAYTDKLDTLEKLKSINETRVLQQIVKNTTGLTQERTKDILDAPELSDKK